MSRSLSSTTWTIVVLYVAVCVLRPAGLIPANLNAPLSALLPLAFAVIHGSRQYGWRGMLAFAVTFSLTVEDSVPTAFIGASLAWLVVSIAGWCVRRKMRTVRRLRGFRRRPAEIAGPGEDRSALT